jgi:hypothetical protein
MPIDYSEYHENWKWLSKQVIKDSGNKCELCFAPNQEIVNRSQYGKYPWEISHKDGGKETKIILTVHHIDSNKKNNTKLNLICLCQRCHLRLDLAKHIANRRKKNETNQIKMPGLCGNLYDKKFCDIDLKTCYSYKNGECTRDICEYQFQYRNYKNEIEIALKIYNEFINSKEYDSDTNFKIWCEKRISNAKTNQIKMPGL